MKLLKRYFKREKKFSLKECFNMVMTVVTCFFMGMVRENSNVIKGIKELIGRQAVSVKEWMTVWNGRRFGIYKIDRIYGEGMLGRSFLAEMSEGIGAAGSGQVLVESMGLRGKKGNRIRDVSHEKGLPCIGRSICRGSP